MNLTEGKESECASRRESPTRKKNKRRKDRNDDG
jgi:hypothetical protein